MIYTLFMFGAVLAGWFVDDSLHIHFGSIRKHSYYTRLSRDNKRRHQKYCFIMGLALFLISALRASSVGFDTETYLGHFIRISGMNWNTMRLRYAGSEPLFYLLLKLVSLVTNEGQWLLALIAMIYAIAISRFIYNYSEDKVISFVMMVPFSYFAFSMSGLRQTIAISIVLSAFRMARSRRFFAFLICIAIAAGFHRSAVFALPIYFLVNLNMNWIKRMAFFVASIFIYVARYQIIVFLQQFFYSEYTISTTGNGTWATLAVLILTWMAYLFISGNDFTSRNKNNQLQLDGKEQIRLVLQTESNAGCGEAIYLVGIVAQTFVPFEPNIFRVAWYYQLFSLIFVPQITSSINLTPTSRRIVRLVYISLMVVMYYGFTYYAAGANPYHFFWQV